MPRPENLARRPAKVWVVRGGLAAVAVVAGYLAVTHSLAQVLVKDNVDWAHVLARSDGRITARLAASFAGSKATDADRWRADQLAREALRQDPTAVVAVSTLGLNAQVRGSTAEARRLFAYSEKLSRRDLQTQLWAIEDAVGRGDIASALRHYDIALRTEPDASQILYPILSSASADPDIRPFLIKTLAAKPPWWDSFVNYLASNLPDPRSTAQLFVGLRRGGLDVPESARAGVINALISGGFTEDAWAYYASTRRGIDRRMSRDPDFTANLVAPSQLDWVSINEGGISTTIQQGIVDFAVPASVSGALLQQMQTLPLGNYRLEGHSIGIEQAENARPYWTLRCQDGRELGRIILPNSSQGGGKFSGQFSVPAGCPVQMLVLTASPSYAVSGLTGQIDRAQLSPVR
nr:hypothetical protein [uncultured Sphingomonas sp.]